VGPQRRGAGLGAPPAALAGTLGASRPPPGSALSDSLHAVKLKHAQGLAVNGKAASESFQSFFFRDV